MASKYEGCVIKNIHWSSGVHLALKLHAEIHDKNGELLVIATLEYCVKVLHERLPRKVM